MQKRRSASVTHIAAVVELLEAPIVVCNAVTVWKRRLAGDTDEEGWLGLTEKGGSCACDTVNGEERV